MKFGFVELLVVFVIALLVLGPDKLPTCAKKLGKAFQEFRKASGCGKCAEKCPAKAICLR